MRFFVPWIIATSVLLVGTAAPWNGSWNGPVLPATCQASQFFYRATDGALYVCTGENTWRLAGIPSGTTVFIRSGQCPVAFTELSAVADSGIAVTSSAMGNVGTTFTQPLVATQGLPPNAPVRTFTRFIACEKN